MAAERSIPRSQAIHPYGPGAILDWGQECFVVLDTSSGRNAGWKDAPTIELPRLQRMFGAGRGFRLPPAMQSDGYKRTSRLMVQRFPAWLFCPKCRRMWRWGRDEERRGEGRLPRCPGEGCSRRNVALVPMRYVAACRGGHLRDINWHRWAHSRREVQGGVCDWKTADLRFEARSGRGATLEALTIRCHTCDSQRDLRGLLAPGALASIGQSCDGRQPWQSRAEEQTCDQALKVLQRSQTAVHFAEVESALDIRVVDECGEARVDAIEATVGKYLDLGLEQEALEPLAEKIAKFATDEFHTNDPNADPITVADVRDWLAKSDKETAPEPGGDADMQAPQSKSAKLLREEWPVLTSTTPTRHRSAPILVRHEALEGDPTASGLPELLDGVFLVDRLREVRVFSGFRRVDTGGQLVYPNLGSERPKWLPAIEVFGEGIFLRLAEPALRRWEGTEQPRLEHRLHGLAKKLDANDPFLRRFEIRRPVLSRFVLVHTFAHMLIRQLCYECGYTGASLRERLYVFPERAGVLIYTADGDSEGSLGGLVRQGRASRLAGSVVAALERASWCSNDPICGEMRNHGPGKTNRAACHACVLVSETSCTESNALLDRELVVGEGSGAAGVRGLFRPVLERSRKDEGGT